MTDLSPGAQAVLAAYYCEKPLVGSKRIAAALRAVVAHLGETHASFGLPGRYGLFVEAVDILGITAELERAGAGRSRQNPNTRL